jgi:hypothetical protein
MGKFIAALIVFLSVLGPARAIAQTTGFTLGPSIGSDGVGADAFYKFNPLFVARGGFRYASFDISREIDDIDYDLDVGFTSGVVALDIHPAANGFRLSGGVYVGDRTLGLAATPASPVEIGDQVFTPQEVGVITGTADWNSAAPFLGLGFNNGAYALKRVGFQAMIGAMYMGSPDVALASTGGILSNDPLFQAELAEEQDRLADDLDDIQFYPVLNIGLTVRF